MLGRILFIAAIGYIIGYIAWLLRRRSQRKRKRYDRMNRSDPRANFKESGIDDADYEEIDENKR